jgi:DNA primase
MHLEERGITPATAHTFRLGYVQDDHGTDWLTIPYLTAHGPVQIKGRRLNHLTDVTGKKQPKYMTLSEHGTGRKLFNVNALHVNVPRVVVCEGELDTIVLSQCDIQAVGLPGSNGWKPQYRLLFQHYDEVFICMDNDEAGSNAASHLLSRVGYGTIKTVPSPHNDITEFFLAEGPQAVRERLGF